MSLINDALRKARLEAARTEASRKATPIPSLHPPVRERLSRPISGPTILLLALGAIAVGIVATLVISRSPKATEQLASAPISTHEPGAEDPATASPEPTAEVTPSAGVRSGSDRSASIDQPPEARSERGSPEPRAVAAESGSVRPEDTTSRRSESEHRRTEEPVEKSDERSSVSNSGSVASGAGEGLTDAPSELADSRTERRQTLPEYRSSTTQAPADSESAAQPASDEAQETETRSYLREATIPGVGTFRLDGIAWSSDQPFALVNGQVVSAGSFVDGAAVTEVARDRVFLSRDGLVFDLRLR